MFQVPGSKFQVGDKSSGLSNLEPGTWNLEPDAAPVLDHAPFGPVPRANVSLKQRNGVGVRDAHTVVFAISDGEVSFQAFGRLFLDLAGS